MKRIATWTIAICILAGLTLAGFKLSPKVFPMKAAEQDVVTTGTLQTSDSAETEGVNLKATKVQVCAMFPMKMEDVQIRDGFIEAFEEVELSAKQPGAIQVIHHEEGAYLKKGEPLFELDVDEYKAQLEQAEVAVELAEKQFARIEKMSKSGVVTQEDFDRVETELRTARVAVKLAKVKVERGTVRSPIDGFFNERMVSPGEYVNPGQVMARIVDIDRVKAVIDVPEQYVLFFKPGDPVTTEYDLNNDTVTTAVGKISFIAMAGDRASHTYPIKVIVDNPDHLMRPGRFVKVRLTARKNENALAVPLFAIITRDEKRSVFIEKDGFAKEVPVELGMISQSMIEVTKGLKEGDRLIVVGQRDLVDGAQVKVEGDLTVLAKQMVAQNLDLSQLGLKALEEIIK